MDLTQLGGRKNGEFERGCGLFMGGEYVGWEEVWVCGEKGKREVNYYLRKKDGSTDLVVKGKEKSLRHISYRYVLPVEDKNSRVYVKLKSRREVVNWLRTIAPVSRAPTHRPFRPIEEHVRSMDFHNPEVDILKGNKMSEVVQTMPSFMWVGLPWICRKKRMHYPSFLRNGVHIYVHDFVYVLAEEDKRLVAYLEDMYEDSRGDKMVAVRWFHKIDEVDIVLPRNYDDREIFFSLCLQDLSIECVDGLATVLSPQHYKKFLSEARHTQLEPFVCYMLYEDDDDVKSFDITEVKGYWKQDILRYLSLTRPSKRVHYDDGVKGKENRTDADVPRPKKRIHRSNEVDEHLLPIKIRFGDVGFQNRDSNFVACEGITKIGNRSNGCLASSASQKDAAMPNCWQHLTVGSQVEVLSQDSGIRGCWYRALIVKKHGDKVKVRYEDIQDAADESKKLEEWLLASKLAVPDEYGIRFTGRSIIRPILSSSQNSFPSNVNVGSIVDVWWHDGWWEGVVVKKDSENKLRVYFPGENQELAFCCDDLRNSQEWLNNGWNKLNERPDIVSSLSLPGPKSSIITCPSTKPDRVTTSDDKDSLFSGLKDVKLEKNENVVVRRPRVVIKPKTDAARNMKDDLLDRLSWKSSGKRCVRRTFHKFNYGAKVKNNGALDTRVQTSERFKISSSSRHDPDYCKSVPTSTPLFSSSAVSNLTSLVMSS
ncbi:hypothetical protein LIER_15625 [Lithospermum erythrorhizon]|uniref:BAH domain-containing protein n=1 Tax=Lithospermum erythrorhizon TaxID=34254 RepID=A0AAV3Q6T6_LITER